MRTVQDAKPITSDHDILGKLSVTVETPEYEGLADFVQNACGGSEQRATEWINGHAKTDAKNAGRLELREAECPPEVAQDASKKAGFIQTLYNGVRNTVKTWDAEVSRRVGTGQAAKAKALEELLTTTDPAERAAKLAALQERFGLK